jgi:hypothetical protein
MRRGGNATWVRIASSELLEGNPYLFNGSIAKSTLEAMRTQVATWVRIASSVLLAGNPFLFNGSLAKSTLEAMRTQVAIKL